MKPTDELARAYAAQHQVPEHILFGHSVVEPDPKDIEDFAARLNENRGNYWAEKFQNATRMLRQRDDALSLAHRHLSIYRWVAIVGWLIAICLLTLQPTYASAATLPVGSLACDNALAYEAQMLTFSDATLVADPGCVFTDRDLTVHPVQGNEVFVEEIGFSVWADVEVLQ